MSTPPQTTGPDLSLSDYVRPVFARWWLIAIVAVVATVGTYVYYDRQTPVYQTSTQLYTEADDSANFVLGTGVGYINPRVIQNQATLISSGVFTRRVAQKLKRSPAEVGGVTASAGADTDFITITASRSSGEEAALIANTFAQTYIEIRSEQARKVLREGLTKSQQQLDRLPRLQSNATERATLAANVRRIKLALELPEGRTTQLSAAPVPGVPLSPKPKRNALFAFVLSLLVGVAAAFGLERFDRRLKRVEDAELAYGTSLLAAIPRAKEPASFVDGRVEISHEFHEAFRQLRTNLQLATLERPLKRILVTSAAPSEGKSTVARNLALAFREFGSSVVVVDADLRRPTQAALMHRENAGAGLTGVLTGEVPLEQALIDVPIAARGLDALARIEAASTRTGSTAVSDHVGEGVKLLPAGAVSANPQAILASRRTSEILADLEARTDIVIIDSPPVATVADALALAGEADIVILVARIGQSTRDGARAARAALDRVPSAIIGGVVVNDLTRAKGVYAYGYETVDDGR